MPDPITQFELVLNRRPLSVQSKNRKSMSVWRSHVETEARIALGALLPFPVSTELHLTMVFFYKDDPIDTDNIVKPIQDALKGIVYVDDANVTDVQSHRRATGTPIDLARSSERLSRAGAGGGEFVYVRVLPARNLEAYL